MKVFILVLVIDVRKILTPSANVIQASTGLDTRNN